MIPDPSFGHGKGPKGVVVKPTCSSGSDRATARRFICENANDSGRAVS